MNRQFNKGERFFSFVEGEAHTRGMTLKELSERLGYRNYGTFARHLKTVTMPAKTMYSITTVLHVDWSEICRAAERALK